MRLLKSALELPENCALSAITCHKYAGREHAGYAALFIQLKLRVGCCWPYFTVITPHHCC